MIGRNGHAPAPVGPPGPRGYAPASPPPPRGVALPRSPLRGGAPVSRPDPEVIRRVQVEASRRLARSGGGGEGELTADMESEVRHVIVDERIVGDAAAIDELVRSVLAQMSGIGWLQEYLEDTELENLRIIGSEPTFVQYAGGRKERRDPVARTDGELVELVRALGARLGHQFGTANPYAHMRLPDGSRMSACVGVSQRPHVALRRHRLVRHTLADLAALGTMSDELAQFLEAAVLARQNILFSGARNAGKTQLLRSSCLAIPPDESIYLAELVAELGIERMLPECIPHEMRDQNSEGAGEVTVARIVTESGRFNTDRVMVGEVLGNEVVPMLSAMSSGLAGSMATIHANSSINAFDRLVMYALRPPERVERDATNFLVSQTIALVVHVEIVWERANGHEARMHRVVSSVREITGVSDDYMRVTSNEVWKPGPDRRAVWSGAMQTSTAEALEAAGWRHPGRAMR